MSEQDLLYDVDDGVARLTINREAQRNALSQETIELFLENLDRAEEDESVRVVLVTGAGERAFCAGADLGSGIGQSGSEGGDAFRKFAGLLKRLTAFPKPTVARVGGSCMAGGMGLMLACDIVFATRAAKFGTPEVNVGLFPMMIGALIFRNVKRKRAMEMVLTGQKFGAAEAREMGLITRDVDPGNLDDEVNAVLDILKSKSPIGMKIGKEAFHAMGDMAFDEALDFLCDQLADVVSTEDAMEGIMAFMEKRKPEFKGK